MVSVGVSEEEKLADAGAFLQPNGVVGEELSAGGYDGDIAIEQRHGQARTHALVVFVDKVRNQLRKERPLILHHYKRVFKVDARGKGETIFLDLQRWLKWFGGSE